MEGSESEEIFDSLNLNPQLFINEVLNVVDDSVDEAFDYFHQEASKLLKIEGTDRSDDLRKGVDCIRKMIQSALNERLAKWEKYCLHHCFSVPDGFSLPESKDSPDDSSKDYDALSDPELDVQLDSLRNKLTSVGEETAELRRELQALERQSVLSNRCAGSVNEAIQLYEQHSMPVKFQELVRTASELRTKMKKLNTKRAEEAERFRTERMQIPNGDMFRMNICNGPFNATLEDLHEFMDDLKTA